MSYSMNKHQPYFAMMQMMLLFTVLWLAGSSSALASDGSDGMVPLEVTTSLPGVEEVVYFVNGVEIARVTQAPFAVQWQPAESGEYRVHTQIRYNDGQSLSTSPELSVNITVALAGS